MAQHVMLCDDLLCAVVQEWNDIFLSWSPDVFGNVVEVRVQAKDIWTPDIVLYN